MTPHDEGFQRLQRDDFTHFAKAVDQLRSQLTETPNGTTQALRYQSQLGVMLITDADCFQEGFDLLKDVHLSLSKTKPTEFWARNAIRWATALQFASRHDEAVAVFNETIAVIKDHDFPLLDFALQHLGKCMMEMGESRKAMNCIQEALQIRIEKGDRELIESSQKALDGVSRLSFRGEPSQT